MSSASAGIGGAVCAGAAASGNFGRRGIGYRKGEKYTPVIYWEICKLNKLIKNRLNVHLLKTSRWNPKSFPK